MVEYNNVFDMAKNLNKSYMQNKFQYNLVKIRQDVQNDALSVFSNVIDAAIEERYSAFKKLGYLETLTKSKIASLEEIKDEINAFNSVFYSKLAKYSKQNVYPVEMISERLENYEELMDNCDKQYKTGIQQANLDSKNVVDEFSK